MNTKFDQAVGVMYQLSGELSRAQASLGRPAPYTAPGIGAIDDSKDYGGPPMPYIPPVVPTRPAAPAMPGGPTSPMPGPKAPDLTSLQPPQTPLPGTPPGRRCPDHRSQAGWADTTRRPRPQRLPPGGSSSRAPGGRPSRPLVTARRAEARREA
jgi:hypothetical protein